MRTVALWMLACGLLLMLYIWQEGLIYMKPPQHWPTVGGTILSREITKDTNDQKESFQLRVKYRYVVDEKTVEYDRIAPAEET